nr:hypothetical protein [Tanacetum cinerariifolium]
MMMYLKNTAGFRLDYFKGISYGDIRPIFEAKFNSNIEFLLKSKEQIEEEENKAIKSINETPAQKAAKIKRLNEEAEDVEELKQHLEIVPDEDDDVYTEATLLTRKVPIVDYQIIKLNNKPQFKIIRADGTHQLYVSFITLLKNFDREDLESLWSIVKERFSTSNPNNFLDDFLLTTLRAMFRRPDGQDQVWTSQRSVHGQEKAKVDVAGYCCWIVLLGCLMLLTGSESRPPMLNKENYVPWSSRLLRYAKSRPNGKLIHNSVLNGPYVRKMIPEQGDANREITITETFHLQTDDELSDKELKQIEADDQAIQTILLGLPEDIYAAEKKAKLFNEWERFTSNEGESIESYYHRFLKFMNDLKRNKHFPKKIASNLKFLNNLQPEWKNTGKLAGYNDVIGNQVIQNAVKNPRVQNGGNQNEEYDLMAAAADLDEIEEVNANCILMANLQQASTSGTQTDSAPVYDTDGLAEVHENCDDNEIFNMFTQEEQYTELLEPIPESHQVPQNDNDVISEDTSMEQGGETVEQHLANFEETRALYESLYQNLAIKVEKVNSVNRKLKDTNTDLTTELARYKNQERCFEISQEKYDKLKRCYQQSIYQEQCLSKKINALHLSTDKQIMTLNEHISDLNKHLSKEKSTISFLLEEKKRLKSDFKTCEDKLLDKQIQLEKRIKELNNIVLKTGQSIQMIHMLSPKPDSFYHTEQKMAFGYQNPFYL